MNARQRRKLAQRARDLTGPLLTAHVVCLRCGEASEAEYRVPPERFVCAHCGERAALREDDDPYPPPMRERVM